MEIESNNMYSGTLNVAKSGYTPIGVIGIYMTNASSDGGGNSRCYVYRYDISGNTLTYRVSNRSTSDTARVMVGFYILYASKTA